MPPIRTEQPQNVGSSTTKQERKKRRHNERPKESAPLGVSKIKSALRQTRRLLAKEGLGADVRIEAERKLKALEGDLVVAETTNKERALATRYHKVKFFDRQKLLRKIRQAKRRLDDEEISSKVRKALNAELFDLRVDLNYVMNYPKLERYISLYPPEVRSREDGATPVHSDVSSSVTDEKREKLREWVCGMMRAGELSNEPETLDYKQAVKKGAAQRWNVSIDKNKRAVGVEEEDLKTRQDMDAPDDFFEEDDTGNENSEAEELANTRFSELPAERRPDKAENHPDKLSKPTEEDPKKARRKKHRKAASPAIIQDSFFGDESE